MNPNVPPTPPPCSAGDRPAETDTGCRSDTRCYASGALFGGNDRIWIDHNGERYSLRITRQRKLILTK